MNSIKLTQWFYFSTQETKLLKIFFFFSDLCLFWGLELDNCQGSYPAQTILWFYENRFSAWWFPKLLTLGALEVPGFLVSSEQSYKYCTMVTHHKSRLSCSSKKRHHPNFKMTALQQSSCHMLELPAQVIDLEYYENICILKCCELYQIILTISFALLMNESRAFHIICNHHGENGSPCTWFLYK